MKHDEIVTTERFKQAALDYPKKLAKGDQYYLYTKPFDGGEDKIYSASLFHSFANILEILELPIRSKILDVACGPGWLTEYLARSGYEVTGLDISPDLIKIARERIEAVKYTTYEGSPIRADFIVSDPELQNIANEIYHAAILFDSLHHFCDPKSTLKHIFEALKPGGKLFIREGVKPEKNSIEEKKLLDEMEKYGTLEKPFEHGELKKILTEVGFIDIQAYEFINLSVRRHRGQIDPELKDIPVPQTNSFLCRKPGEYTYDSRYPGKLLAQIENLGDRLPGKVSAGELIQIKLKIRNTGDTIWLHNPNISRGFVVIGAKLIDNEGNFITDNLERTIFESDVHPGESVVVDHQFKIPNVCGRHKIKIDLVDELITWFEEKGSKPLVLIIDVQR